MEKFAPTIVVDGETVTPEPWMWILGYALAGVDWAVKEVRSPKYNLRSKIDDYNKRKQTHFAKIEIEYLECELAKYKAML